MDAPAKTADIKKKNFQWRPGISDACSAWFGLNIFIDIQTRTLGTYGCTFKNSKYQKRRIFNGFLRFQMLAVHDLVETCLLISKQVKNLHKMVSWYKNVQIFRNREQTFSGFISEVSKYFLGLVKLLSRRHPSTSPPKPCMPVIILNVIFPRA